MPRLILDWDAWDNAKKRQKPAMPASETLAALDERLRQEHRDMRHAGKDVHWGMDLAGIYCTECLNVDYHFNLYPFDDFIRVIEGVENSEEVHEFSFLQEPLEALRNRPLSFP